ncbi:SGNH/GDSL hydrolase family protein [Limosilactobacillus fermentum]|uniref:SGNH/GDSL hydrolase family protein n=1 Tax=Limosilactobacillus fermentum TaxID=1613 RepID=UPI003F968BBD
MTKMIALGDSIFAGLASDGQGGHVQANPTIPQMVASALRWECNNQSIGGTKFTDSDGKGTNFTDQVKKFNFADYDRVLIGYGINDYDDSPYPPPYEVMDAIKRGVEKIRSDNSAIKIYIEVPTASFAKNNTNQDAKNEGGYTQREINDAIVSEAKALSIPYFDYRDKAPYLITYANRNEVLDTWMIHPTVAVMQQMAELLSEWIEGLERPAVVDNGSSSMSFTPDPIKWVDLNGNSDNESTSGNSSATYTVQQIDKLDLAKINSVSDLISTLNDNVKKIWTAMMGIAGEVTDTGWTPQTFDLVNRQYRNYIIDTVTAIQRYASGTLGGTEMDDDNGNQISVEAYSLSRSLFINDVITSLNSYFTVCQTCLNSIIDSMY